MSNLFSVDEKAVEDAFTFDESDTELDWERLAEEDFSQMDLSDLDLSDVDFSGIYMPTLSEADVASLLSGVKVNISAASMQSIFQSLMDGYMAYSALDPSTDYARLPESIQSYLGSDAAREIVRRNMESAVSQLGAAVITGQDLQAMLQEVMAGFPAYAAANTPVDPETGEPQAADAGTLMAGYLQSPEVQAILESQAENMRARLQQTVLDQDRANAISQELLAGYQIYAQENQLPDVSRMQDSFAAYMYSADAQAILSSGVAQAVDTSQLEQQAAAMFSSYSGVLGQQISAMMERVVTALINAVSQRITDSMGTLMEKISENFTNAFTMDPKALAEAFSMNFSMEELRDLLLSLMSEEQTSYNSNLRRLGYADLAEPASITIYPKDFEGKMKVKELLDGYNDMQREAGNEEQVITYNDVVDTLMRSVTDIIDSLSYVLIAFVGISLVVSSIMIGVITYISVLERNKEIGILRAIGASKRNISQVFNAETFIIGALAGLIGIGISYLLHIPMNHIMHTMAETDQINALLKPTSALMLVGLSVLLTMIGGIIPSQKASRSDPVAALRSE